MATCPRCSGRRSGFSISCGPQGCTTGQRNCFTCKGSGEITQDHAQRIRVGDVMRKERIARLATIREDATRLGCDFPEWSRIENGNVPETDNGRQAYSNRVNELNEACALDT